MTMQGGGKCLPRVLHGLHLVYAVSPRPRNGVWIGEGPISSPLAHPPRPAAAAVGQSTIQESSERGHKTGECHPGE